MMAHLKFTVLLLAIALTGCWQAVIDIYSAEDFFVPFRGDIISLNDEHGPLGLYHVDAQNRYVPVLKDAPATGPEKEYRQYRFGLVALDQMLAWPTKRDSWRTDRIISSQAYPDEDRLLLINVASKPNSTAQGQALTVARVSGNTFSRGSGAVFDKSPNSQEFQNLQGKDGIMKDGVVSLVEKSYVAILVKNEIIRARKQGTFRCTDLTVKIHPKSARTALFQAAKSGDGRRAIARQHDREERKIAAAREAERRAKEQNRIYDTDGYYLVTPGALTRLKRGKDRNTSLLTMSISKSTAANFIDPSVKGTWSAAWDCTVTRSNLPIPPIRSPQAAVVGTLPIHFISVSLHSWKTAFGKNHTNGLKIGSKTATHALPMRCA